MTFRFGGGSVRRYRLRADTETFEWRPQRRTDGPVFRDMSRDFEEPDRYPKLVGAEKPGMMASKGEKAIHGAVASGDPEAMLVVGGQYRSIRTSPGRSPASFCWSRLSIAE